MLCRSRRFGKTLLLDTVDNIFSGRKELFKNLAIGKINSGYDWKTFPVLRIDLVGTGSAPDNLDKIAIEKLKIVDEDHEVNINQKSSSLAILSLIKEVSNRHIEMSKINKIEINTKYPANVALLIDEYDYPLQDKILDFERSGYIRAVPRFFLGELRTVKPGSAFV